MDQAIEKITNNILAERKLSRTEVNKICSYLRLVRDACGISQEEIGAYIGLSKSAYGKKELGIVEFTLFELVSVTKYLGINFADLDKIKSIDFGSKFNQRQ